MVFNPATHQEVEDAVEALLDAVNGTIGDSIDAAVDNAPHDMEYDGTQWPIRPDTSGTNRKVYWWGPSTASLPNTGTSSGGTRAAAPGDRKFLS